MKWRCKGLGWPGLVMHMVYLVLISLNWELPCLKCTPAVVLFTVLQPSVGWVGFLCPCWGTMSLYTVSCDCLLRGYIMQLRSKPCHLPATKWFKAVFPIFTKIVHSNCEEDCSEISPCICLSVCKRSKQPSLSAKEMMGRSAENWKYCRQ